MRGRVVVWHDDRGFGFIEPESGGDRVFLHVGDFRGRARPAMGVRVRYRTTRTPKGVKAVGVRSVDGWRPADWIPSRRWSLSLPAFGMFAALWAAVSAGALPVSVLAYYVALSAMLFALYGWDKRAAQRRGQRTPEVTLQVLALSGGWPGALLAQQLYRHKTSKRSFQFLFWILVMLNCIGLWLFFSPRGIVIVRQGLALILGGR